MTGTAEYYEQLVQAFRDTEQLSVLIVAGRSRQEVAAELGVDSSAPVDVNEIDEEESTAWALLEVPGGVLAVEWSGYGDPTLASLRTLTENGAAAAVVRHNIQAHLRFGCARDGDVLFDDDEYTFLEDPSMVPSELRPLFDLVWDDLDDDGDDDFEAGGGPDAFAVGLAMAEVITGIELTSEQVAAVEASEFYAAPSLVYVPAEDE